MEPIQKNVRRAILDANPLAAPEDVEEYERLLAERFATDPDAPAAPEAMIRPDERLSELHRKLFPGHKKYTRRQ